MVCTAEKGIFEAGAQYVQRLASASEVEVLGRTTAATPPAWWL